MRQSTPRAVQNAMGYGPFFAMQHMGLGLWVCCQSNTYKPQNIASFRAHTLAAYAGGPDHSP